MSCFNEFLAQPLVRTIGLSKKCIRDLLCRELANAKHCLVLRSTATKAPKFTPLLSTLLVHELNENLVKNHLQPEGYSHVNNFGISRTSPPEAH